METVIFDTALGHVGLGWTDKGIARLQLTGLSNVDLEQRLNRGGARPGEPPRFVEAVMNQIEDYAAGEQVDLSDTRLDLAGVPDFHRRAYVLLMQIRRGATTTYGALAPQLGDVKLARAVGQATGANPIPLIIPYHRVLASNGKSGGFSAPGGLNTKARMLALEGVVLGTPPGQLQLGF
jgi:methylated-DNA-[protein]-cysteine S-methyltransferase